MSNIFAILLQVVAMTVSPASAQSPSAVVEEVGAGVTGVQFMDYELAGKSGAMVFRQAPKIQGRPPRHSARARPRRTDQYP